MLAIAPCPPVEPDDGSGRRLVTGTFEHSAGNVLDLRTEGSDKSIGVTANHPFWSEDRRSFVAAGELESGETLRLADGGTTTVAGIASRGTTEVVYNLEVEGQHVYCVGRVGLLVYNTYPTLA